ncbi:kinase-like protein [Xylona heveae TC161]|uniref:Kinase-like protein n=1 Tax=Xylona heveae (strain CBS 132557 / TC161) TaxID=1328760 RepID=A0A165I443_XYLHT|nr:kinase-like protein [Xylona heveae TC161]KZF24355.1 kinase-like protein [Xylona heveae TC161]
MSIQCQFPGVRWIGFGAISYVYKVHRCIVVKVPKSGEFEREQFDRELEIYQIFSRHPPCPSVVQCFFYSDNGIFLEYMRDVSLSARIQNNHIRDCQTRIVTKVEKLEPLSLRKEWINDLAQAVAFLESLNLAHGDLRPENILLDGNRLKLSDFDCAAEIGTNFEACVAPYGRILNGNETDQGQRGTSGFLGPRTEQFALGSLYYLINYGFEVYEDRCLTEDSKEHGPKVVDFLQNMEFPNLDGDPLIDDIIDKCWHNKYATVVELAAHTATLLTYRTNQEGTPPDTTFITQLHMVVCRIINGIWSSFGDWWTLVCQTNGKVTNTEQSNGREPNSNSYNVDQAYLTEDFLSKKAFCQNLEKCELPRLLSSDEPERLGFTLEWHSS